MAKKKSSTKRIRKVVSITLDPDVWAETTRRMKFLGMERSAYVEAQLIAFLQMTESMVPLFEKIEAGEVVNAREAKLAYLRQLAELQGVMSGFHADTADLTRWAASPDEEDAV